MKYIYKRIFILSHKKLNQFIEIQKKWPWQNMHSTKVLAWTKWHLIPIFQQLQMIGTNKKETSMPDCIYIYTSILEGQNKINNHFRNTQHVIVLKKQSNLSKKLNMLPIYINTYIYYKHEIFNSKWQFSQTKCMIHS